MKKWRALMIKKLLPYGVFALFGVFVALMKLGYLPKTKACIIEQTKVMKGLVMGKIHPQEELR